MNRIKWSIKWSINVRYNRKIAQKFPWTAKPQTSNTTPITKRLNHFHHLSLHHHLHHLHHLHWLVHFLLFLWRCHLSRLAKYTLDCILLLAHFTKVSPIPKVSMTLNESLWLCRMPPPGTVKNIMKGLFGKCWKHVSQKIFKYIIFRNIEASQF